MRRPCKLHPKSQYPSNSRMPLQVRRVEAIAIAAPASLHYALAKAALQAGKDVFVEKPLCLDQARGRGIGSAWPQSSARFLWWDICSSTILACVHCMHLLASGELGKLHYITSNRLNLGQIRREENALWSFAPHDISVILSLAGGQLPDQVRCTGGELSESTCR